MQSDGTRLSAQGEPAGEGAGRGCAECASWRERERVLLQCLSGAEGNARYWQSMHRRAQERAAKCEALQREQTGKLGELERQVEVLQQENAGLQQRNRDLLRKPFGTSSEKRPQGQDGGPAGGGQPGQGSEKRRQRGVQPGAAAPKRVDRSGLPRREEVLEPEPGPAPSPAPTAPPARRCHTHAHRANRHPCATCPTSNAPLSECLRCGCLDSLR